MRAGKLKAATWYIEEDAGKQAADLAGSNVRLPYFFVGDPPDGGATWPKHRCGGAAFLEAFLERWLDGLAAREEQVGVTQKAPGKRDTPMPETDKDVIPWLQEKLKGERAKTRALAGGGQGGGRPEPRPGGKARGGHPAGRLPGRAELSVC